MTNPSDNNPFATPDAHRVAQNEEQRRQQEAAAQAAYAQQQAEWAQQQAVYAQQQAPYQQGEQYPGASTSPQWTSQQWQGQVGATQHAPYQPGAAHPSPYQQAPGPSPYPPQYSYYQQQPPAPASATTSLVLGIISIVAIPPIGIAALIVGIVAMRKIRRTGSQGKGPALAGIITGAIGTAVTIFVAIMIAVVVQAVGETSVQIDGPKTIDSRKGMVGHCLDVLPETDSNLSYSLVPCTTPHAAEIIASRSVARYSDYPDTREAIEELNSRCLDSAFSARRQMTDLGLEKFEIFAAIPDEDDWGTAFDPQYHCMVTPAEGKMRGSFYFGDVTLEP